MWMGYLPAKASYCYKIIWKIYLHKALIWKTIEAEWLLCSSAALWNSLCAAVYVCVWVCYLTVVSSVCLVTAKTWSNSAHERVNTSFGLGITHMQTKTNKQRTHPRIRPVWLRVCSTATKLSPLWCSCLCILTWPFQTDPATSSSALWS